MKILSIECSASPVSVAVSENGNVLASDFSNQKVTHSQTLMPMIVKTLEKSGVSLSEIDGFAVAAGPGSFTGVRIGISAVKGMAAPDKTLCAAVSTLEAMAAMHTEINGIISPVMDARCNQVYNALFEAKDGNLTRLTPDRALLCDELASELVKYNKTVIICGDGTDVFLPFVKDKLSSIHIPEGDAKFQNAIGVFLCAEKMFKCEKTVSPDELLPIYLRLPQAERELNAKKQLSKG